MNSGSPIRVAFIGDGTVSRSVIEVLSQDPVSRCEIVGILCRSKVSSELHTSTLDDLLRRKPTIVVECASQAAVADYGPAVLEAGCCLLIASVGALADADLFQRIYGAADRGRSQIVLVPGAIAGIDALAAARIGGLEWVRYTGRKPPSAWMGTPAEQAVDLRALTEPYVVYRGSAREASLLFPKNANVAATVALAGVGFDDTEVELIADPGIAKNIHELRFSGRDCRFEMTLENEPSRLNPKTSALTAHSIAVELQRRGSGPALPEPRRALMRRP